MYKFLKVIPILFSIPVLLSCSGGGGSTSSSTTTTIQAVAGAPMSYASVSIKSLTDSTSTTLTADVDGNISVSSLSSTVTPPALITATSQSGNYTYYSYWKNISQTSIAVNPITTTLLALAANTNPSLITSALDLTSATTSVKTVFADVFTAASVSATSLDFISSTFTANHTGLDLVLDSIQTSVNLSGTVTLTNKLNGTNLSISTNSVSAMPFNAQAVTLMQNAPIKTCSDVLTGLTSAKLASDTTIYDSSYLDNGKNRSQFMTEIATISSSTPFTIKMPIFAGLDGNNNYKFNMLAVNSSTGAYISDLSVPMKLVGSNCVLTGNQLPFEISIQPAIKHTVRVDGTTSANTTATPVAGIEVQLGSNGASLTYNGTAIASARVDMCDENNSCTLLAKLSTSNGSSWFSLDSSNYSGTNYSFLQLIPNPSFSLINSLSNPIKVSFFSTAPAPTTGTTNLIGTPVMTRSSADKFSTAEIAAVTQPSVINKTIIQNVVATPTLNYDAGSTIISSISMTNSVSGQSATSSEKLILAGGTGSVVFTGTSPSSSDYYRAIYVAGHIPGRNGMIQTKYVWSPTCSGCY